MSEEQQKEYLAKVETHVVSYSIIYSRNIYWAITPGLYGKINLEGKFQTKEWRF